MDCHRTSILMTFKFMFACCSRRALSEHFRLRRWHCGLGEVEQADADADQADQANQADAEHGQVRGHLMYSVSASTTNTDRWRPNHRGAVRPWSRHLHWSRLLDARAHVKRTVSRCFAALRQLLQIRRSGADSHVPDARSGSGTLTTRLQQCNTGRHSGLPGTPFAFDAQRGGTTHLPSATVRPHLRCVGDTALAVRPRTLAVQNRGANVQSASRQRATISGTLSPSLTCPVSELCGQQVKAV